MRFSSQPDILLLYWKFVLGIVNSLVLLLSPTFFHIHFVLFQVLIAVTLINVDGISSFLPRKQSVLPLQLTKPADPLMIAKRGPSHLIFVNGTVALAIDQVDVLV